MYTNKQTDTHQAAWTAYKPWIKVHVAKLAIKRKPAEYYDCFYCHDLSVVLNGVHMHITYMYIAITLGTEYYRVSLVLHCIIIPVLLIVYRTIRIVGNKEYRGDHNRMSGLYTYIWASSWDQSSCPKYGGVCYRKCPLREVSLYVCR